MTVVVITPPAAMPVTLDQAKANLRVDNTDEDAFITSLIQVVSAGLDGPDGLLGRSLVIQTLELRLDAFPPTCFDDDRSLCLQGEHRWSYAHTDIPLPFPPIVSITSVKYFDTDGADQTLTSSAYQVLAAAGRARISLVSGQSWPDAPFRREGIRIRYVAGYGADDIAVPAPIRHAILLKVANLYTNRESVVLDSRAAIEMPQSAEALLAPYRVCSL
jgi:uncharacterized phiE125 gp8 family phage protein